MTSIRLGEGKTEQAISKISLSKETKRGLPWWRNG